MAFTQLYLTTNTAPYTPATIRGAWNQTASAVTRAFDVQKVSGGNITTIAIAETNASANHDVLLGRWVSGPIAAQTFSGTLDCVLGLRESNAAADLALHIHAYVTQGDSDTVRGTLLSDYVETTGNEFATTATGQAFAAAQSLTAVVASAGDRIVIEVGYVALNASATSYTGTLNYGTIVAATDLPAGDLTAGSTSVTTLAGFFTFSASVAEATSPMRESQAAVEVLADDAAPSLRHSQTALEVFANDTPSLRHSQTIVEVLWEYRIPPGGGGGVVGGVDPPAAILPTGVIRTFVRFSLNDSPTTEISVAETLLRDDADWFGGKKLPLLKSIAPIDRKLSTSVQGVSCRIGLHDDESRIFRTLSTTGTFAGALAEVFIVSDTVRYAKGQPYRLFAGKVGEVRFGPQFSVEVDVLDVLSEELVTYADSARIPPGRLTPAELPGMDAAFEGGVLPVALGELNDENEPGNISVSPQGVVPPIIVGRVNFTAFGGINQDAIACVVTHGAVAPTGLWTVYYNTPDNPYTRIPIPSSGIWGVYLWAPGHPGWSQTGFTTDYADYPLPLSGLTRRYTPLYIDANHPNAQPFLDGKILVGINMYGLTETADGSGLYLSDAPRIYQWLLTNFFYSEWKTGNYNAIPITASGYSIVNTASIDTATTVLRSFGGGAYPVGFLLGRNNQQQTLRHVLQELCEGVGMEQGIDRHGRLMVDAHDTSDTTPILTVTDLLDIEDGTFEVWVDRSGFVTDIEYVHGYRYLPPSAPVATPAEGDALPKSAVLPYQDWTSGLQVASHAGALAANGGKRKKRFLENWVVRSATVAADVVDRLLTRAVGPAPSYDGQRMFRLTTSWQGLGSGATEVELGSLIAIDHIEGPGASGYLGKLCRVMSITVDPLRARVTLEGWVV